MIKETYCSFEVAKLLKEKGFEGDCIAAYNGNGKLFIDEEIDDNDNIPYWSDAPTHQMAMAWLRKKGLHINILYKNLPNSNFLYYWSIAEHEDIKSSERTYEEAVEAALKYCLHNLI